MQLTNASLAQNATASTSTQSSGWAPSQPAAASSSISGYHVRARVSQRASQSRETWSSLKANARQKATDLSGQVKTWKDERERATEQAQGPTRPDAAAFQSSSSFRQSNLSYQPRIRPSLPRASSAKSIKQALSSAASLPLRSIAKQEQPAQDVVFPVLLPGYTFARLPLGSDPTKTDEDELYVVLRGFIGRKSATMGRAQRMFNLMARQLARLPKPLSASSVSLLLDSHHSSTDDAHFFPSRPPGADPELQTEQEDRPPLSERIIEGVTDHLSSETLGKIVDKLGVLPIDGEGGVHEDNSHHHHHHLHRHHDHHHSQSDHHHRDEAAQHSGLVAGQASEAIRAIDGEPQRPLEQRGAKAMDDFKSRRELPLLKVRSKDLEADLLESLGGSSSSVSSSAPSSAVSETTLGSSRDVENTPSTASSSSAPASQDANIRSCEALPPGAPSSVASSSKLARLKGLTPLSSTSLSSTRSAPVGAEPAAGWTPTSVAGKADPQLVGGSDYWARRTLDEIHQLTQNLNERLSDFWMYRMPHRTVRIEIQGSFISQWQQSADEKPPDVSSSAENEWRTLLAQELKADLHGMFRLKVKMGPLAVFGEDLKTLRSRAVLLESSEQSSMVTTEQATEWIALPLPTRRRRWQESKALAHKSVDSSAGRPLRLISDVDDTIRLTNVTLGLKSVFRQVFVLPHHETCVAGMSDWYNHLVQTYNVGVHFVSNAPVELWRPLRQFLHTSGMPEGSHLHLKSYNSEVESSVSNAGSEAEGNTSGSASAKAPQQPKTSLLSTWLQPASQRKRAAIVSILDDFPDDHFLLVGDTGELDLELYADLAKERPHQIKALYLRDVTSPIVPVSAAAPVTASSSSSSSATLSPQIVARLKEVAKKKRGNAASTTESSVPGTASSLSGSAASSTVASPALAPSGAVLRDQENLVPTLLELGPAVASASSKAIGSGATSSTTSSAPSSSLQFRYGLHTTSAALQGRIARAKALIDATQTELHFFRRGDDDVRSECLRLVERLQDSRR